MPSTPQPQRAPAPGPSPAEQVVLESFARHTAALGGVLAASRQLRLEGCAPLDLASSTSLEFLLLSVRMAAKQHLQRGEDLLRLIDRAEAMLDASRGVRPEGTKTDAGIQMLRAIAMAELLHEESRGRFARQESLRQLADGAMASLVNGFVLRFGGDLPAELRKAFPAFAAAIRDAWRPVEARRGLLLWLTKRS
jgi:hypothetical protein